MRRFRKTIAMVMLLLITLSGLPANVFAEGAVCPNCGSNNFENGYTEVWEEATCTTAGKIETARCFECGYAAFSYPAALGHSWTQWHSESSATCTEGATEVSYCDRCQEKTTRQIAALGHNWGAWQATKAATCTEEGTEQRTCVRCGYVQNQSIAALGHSFGEWQTTKAATCTEGGTEQSTCSRCGETQTRSTAALGHSWSGQQVVRTATCKAPELLRQTCNRCGLTQNNEGSYAAHTWGTWVKVKEPTPLEAGLEERKCSVCGKTEQRNIYVDGVLRRGDRGDEVKELQEALNNAGYDCGEADGIFGGKTEEAILAFQEDHDMEKDGIGWPGIKMLLSSSIHLEITEDLSGVQAHLGDTIPVEMKVTNTGETTIVIFDTKATYDDGTEIELNIGEKFVSYGGYLVPGMTDTYWIHFNVTEKDLERGEVVRKVAKIGVSIRNEAGEYYEWDGVTQDLPLEIYEEYNARDFVDSNLWVWSNMETIVIPLAEDGDDAEETGDDEQFGELDGVTLTKRVSEFTPPTDGEYYVQGDEIEYVLELTNNSENTIIYTEIFDPLCWNPETESYLAAEFGEIAPGESRAAQYIYMVTIEDAVAGTVVNQADAFYIAEVNGEKIDYASKSNIVEVPTHMIGDEPTPAEDDPEEPTEESTPTETPIPTEAPTEEPTPTEAPAPTEEPAPTEAPAEEPTPTETPVPTEAPVETEEPKPTEVPVEEPKPTEAPAEDELIFDALTEFTIQKAETSAPANGEYYTEGETISYTITYSNTGDTPFGETIIYDILQGGTMEIGSAEHLYSSEQRSCSFEHTVTAADVERGYVVNAALATFDINGLIGTARSNLVISDTDGVPDDEETVRRSGRIKTPIRLSGETEGAEPCTRALLGRTGDSMDYQVGYCEIHDKTRDDIDLMLSNASTKEIEEKAWEYAIILWQENIDIMYEAMLEAADDTAKIAVMNERLQFYATKGAYETLLKLQYPEDSVTVMRLIAEYVMNKSVDMCYELHTAPQDRIDRYDLVTTAPASGLDLDDCGWIIVDILDDKIHYQEQFSRNHVTTLTMQENILAGDEEAQLKWEDIGNLWEIERKMESNACIGILGKEHKETIAAEYNLFLNWLNAREDILNALYPEREAVVKEMLATASMERTRQLCGFASEAE